MEKDADCKLLRFVQFRSAHRTIIFTLQHGHTFLKAFNVWLRMLIVGEISSQHNQGFWNIVFDMWQWCRCPRLDVVKEEAPIWWHWRRCARCAQTCSYYSPSKFIGRITVEKRLIHHGHWRLFYLLPPFSFFWIRVPTAAKSFQQIGGFLLRITKVCQDVVDDYHPSDFSPTPFCYG